MAASVPQARADRTWDRGAGTNFWTDAQNWNPDGLPTSADGAIFTDTAAGTVDLNGSTQPASGSLTSLTFNNATTGYTLQNGTINLAGALNSNAGASVTNTVSAAITSTSGIAVNSGTLVLTNGNNSIAGPVSIAAGAKLDVLTPSSNSIGGISLNGGTLVIRGGATTVSGLQGRLYVDNQTNPVGNSAGVNTLLNTAATNTQILTSANGPNGGLDFRNDGDFQNFFNQPLVNSNGNHNYTVAFVGNYAAQATGTHTFALAQQDDNSAIYVDANQNGTFESGEQVVGKGCCNSTTQSTPGTVSLNAGQTYKIAILNEETGGGSDLGATFQDPNAAALSVIAPNAGTQPQFTFNLVSSANLSGSAITVTANSTVDVESTAGTLGNVSFNAGTSLTVTGGLPDTVATLGGLSGTGTATLNTSVPTTAGALSGFTTFTKGGNSTLTLATDAPSFNGNIVVSAGTLRAGSVNALGSTTGNTTVQSGGQLSILADNIAEPVTLNGTGPSNNGALESGAADSNSHTFAGPITLASDSFIVSSVGGKALTLTGGVATGGVATGGFQARFGGSGDINVNTTGISGTGGIRKTEGGTLTVNAASPYTGTTQIDAGTFAFTVPLTGSATINQTAGTINANAAVKSGAAVNITGGLFNANAAGALNGNNTVLNTGVLRVTTAVGAGGSINVNVGGELRFDGANTSLTTPTNNINVDSNGLIHAASGIADLSTQNLVINPRTLTSVNNALRAVAINATPTDPTTGAAVNTVLGLNPSVRTTLPNANGGALSFTSDAAFNTFFGTTLNDAFTGYFNGKFTAPSAGSYQFRVTNNDDTGVVAVDADNNGSFSDAPDQTASVTCCGKDTNVTLTLAAGQTVGVFYGLRDTGGGSGLVGHFTLPGGTDTIVTPGDAAQANLWSYVNVTGGGSVQIDSGAELRARTLTGATAATLAGTLTLTAGTAGSPLASNVTTLTATGTLPVVNTGANHTLTLQTLAVPGGSALPTTFTKTGAGTLAVTGNTAVTLNNSSIVANAGVTDMSSTVITAAAKTTVTGLQGRLYVNAQVNPRVIANGGAGAAAVNALINSAPTATALLTSANGPNGGLDFRNDNDFATFFNNTQVGNGGNSNYTVAFVGNYTAQATGSHLFGFEQNDDNSAIYLDLNHNGQFEDSEKVFDRGCCLQNPPNADFESGTVNLTAGQTYAIAVLNEETGGGSDLGAKFQDPNNTTAPIVIAPDGTTQQPFTFSTGGGAIQVDPGATLSIAGTTGPVDATVNGTLTYAAQSSASASNLNNVSVAASQTGTLNILANQNVSITGSLALNGNLVKTGAGRLAVNVVGTGTGSVTILGGVFGGTGSIAGPASVAGPIGTGGTIAPGNSVGTLSTGSFSITSAGGTVAIELDPVNSQGNGTSDNLNVTGTVALTGGNLAVTLLSNATAPGQQFQIITNDGSDPVVGTFATANGSTISGNSFSLPGGYTFSINYAAGTGNDVVLTATAVPEPAALGLLGAAALGLLARRRRRRAN